MLPEGMQLKLPLGLVIRSTVGGDCKGHWERKRSTMSFGGKLFRGTIRRRATYIYIYIDVCLIGVFWVSVPGVLALMDLLFVRAQPDKP